MADLIRTVYEYPWTSFWVFLMICTLLQIIVEIVSIVFLRESKNKKQ